MEIKQYIQFFWRWLWLMLLASALAGTAAFFFSQRTTPTYEASTTLLVVQGRPSRDGLDVSELEARAQLANTYVELLSKRPVLEGVIVSLGLDTDVTDLAEQININFVRDTQLIELTAEDTDPRRAAAIANAMVQVFNQQEATLLANPYAANQPGLHVVEIAVAPIPTDAIPLRQVLLAAVAGAMVAIGMAFLLEYLDESIRSGSDIEKLTGLPMVATITRIRGGDLPKKLITITDPDSPTAETYRMIRAHLEFAAVDRPIRSITVTSSRKSEGKSTTAANLAVALAQSGLRVVLVDTNLRDPKLHAFFEQPNHRGFSTAIAQPEQHNVVEHLLPSGVDNLQLLLSGPLPRNPARLLVPQRLAQFIEDLKVHADMVIFDSPPLLDVIDTTLLVRASDATLLVVLAHKTQVVPLLRAQEHLVRARTRLLGVVLNRASRSGGNDYNYVMQGMSYPSHPALEHPNRELSDPYRANGQAGPNTVVRIVDSRDGTRAVREP